MFAILQKEISSFFSSIIAYVVICIFLIANGIFLWILPDSNIFDAGYANLNSLFELAPWVFMFLIPAVTMRSFAEEHKNGTIEILFTKPISDFQIIAGKYLAGLVLSIIAVLPTLLYCYTVYFLASPVGNIDTGGIIGSYIGLFFLASVYVSIGIYSSSINDNQIISFIIALFICFFFYVLIDLIRGLFIISTIDPVLQFISISTHYSSISRGIIDTRDIIYFISFNAIFIVLTRLNLERRKW
jgi:ABC-2 type transport system permease protein